MSTAQELIKKYGIDKAFEISIENSWLDICRDIERIERDVFGEYTNSLDGHGQYAVCPTPLRLDVYNTCNFNCAYCFANQSKKRVIVSANTKRLIKSLNTAMNGNDLSGYKNIAGKMIHNRWPLHIGGISDPMPHIEKQRKILWTVLKNIRDYPIVISTKSDLPLIDNNYFYLLRDIRNNLVFQMSLITLKEKNILEPE